MKQILRRILKLMITLLLISTVSLSHFTVQSKPTKTVTVMDKIPKYYRQVIHQLSKYFLIPESLIYSIIYNESRGNPNVTSYCGAVGWMQVTPKTYVDMVQALKKFQPYWYKRICNKSLYNYEANLIAGVYRWYYITRNTSRGDFHWTATAYHGGEVYAYDIHKSHGTYITSYSSSIFRYFVFMSSYV